MRAGGAHAAHEYVEDSPRMLRAAVVVEALVQRAQGCGLVRIESVIARHVLVILAHILGQVRAVAE